MHKNILNMFLMEIDIKQLVLTPVVTVSNCCSGQVVGRLFQQIFACIAKFSHFHLLEPLAKNKQNKQAKNSKQVPLTVINTIKRGHWCLTEASFGANLGGVTIRDIKQ